jgi:hypothetical protein
MTVHFPGLVPPDTYIHNCSLSWLGTPWHIYTWLFTFLAWYPWHIYTWLFTFLAQYMFFYFFLSIGIHVDTIYMYYISLILLFIGSKDSQCRHGRDRIVVGFLTTYAINAYLTLWVRLAARRWFPPGTPVSSTNKTDHHDITEI